jgi:aspartyl-tRNA(Asn)/glutamyl-tRNA(Gln) amidotransferase subunit B
MEQGSLRCDANVSVRRPGESFGTRCEIKNLNSIRFLVRAIEFEAARQIEVLEDDGLVRQETRLFDPNRSETRSMRSKEDAHDYRYFPDPDLLPLRLDSDWVAELKEGLPELPDQKMSRFMEEYGLSAENADVLVSERDRAEFFESVAKGRDPKQAANWVIGDLLGKLNKSDTELVDVKIDPAELGHLIDLINKGAISGRMAKQVFEEMFETGKRADDVVVEQGFTQVSDEGALVGHIREVLDRNADKVVEYKTGKEKLLGFFVGQVMKATDGKANPKLVNQLLQAELSER